MRNNEPGAGSAQARDTSLFAQLPPDDLEETAAEKLRKSGIFTAAPGPDAGTGNNHLSLSELRELHEQRRRLGTDWEMPEHLATCSLCLEIFQCLQDGLPELSGPPRQDLKVFSVMKNDLPGCVGPNSSGRRAF